MDAVGYAGPSKDCYICFMRCLLFRLGLTWDHKPGKRPCHRQARQGNIRLRMFRKPHPRQAALRLPLSGSGG